MAFQSSSLSLLAGDAHRRNVVAEALRDGAVRTVSQPIISLSTGEIAGFEALSRPQCPAPLDAPAVFLSVARDAGLELHADRTWRRLAIERLAPQLPPEALLFLNVSPSSLLNAEFRGPPTADLVRRYGLAPERVVFELTEEESITDFAAVRRVLAGFRSEGFGLAIDDAGAGPSSLQSVVELRPNYIKLDRWLTQGIEGDSARRAMVKALVEFAHRTRARVIAEGIETEAELEAFIALDVDYGQGFLLGRPAPGVAPASPATTELITSAAGRRGVPVRARAASIMGLTFIPPVIPAAMAGEEVLRLFEEDMLLEVVAVEDAGEVTAIITRERILLRFARQYGFAVYARKSAIQLAQPATIIDSHTPARRAAELALQRAPSARHDPLVVIHGGALAGCIEVLDLMRHLLNADPAAPAAHAA
ncbi:MAG: EAL domain-containing protein [Chloroflexi bacterium]|nr:EAL domain-containing protein [Chloroflexota bacterium]